MAGGSGGLFTAGQESRVLFVRPRLGWPPHLEQTSLVAVVSTCTDATETKPLRTIFHVYPVRARPASSCHNRPAGFCFEKRAQTLPEAYVAVLRLDAAFV